MIMNRVQQIIRAYQLLVQTAHPLSDLEVFPHGVVQAPERGLFPEEFGNVEDVAAENDVAA